MPVLNRGLSMPASTSSFGSEGSVPLKLKIMTWNIAIITFPLVAPSLKAFLHLTFFWGSAHNRFSDVSLVPLESSSLGRLAQQADYIRQSGADIIMLQEVPGKAYVDHLMMFLGSDYDVYYEAKRPTLGAKLMYAGFTLFFATMQFLLFEPILRVFILPYWLELTGGALGRWLLLVGIRALMMRTSTIVQFLLGSVGSQLVTLRRRTSLIVGIQAAAAAEHGGSSGGSGGGSSESSVRVADFWTFPSPQIHSALDVFFTIRPRGVLDVSFPVLDARGRCSSLRVLNTHLPHAVDPAVVLADFGRKVSRISSQHASVIVGGDFNPLPRPSVRQQFRPLLDAGCEPTNDLDQPIVTWDLANPITRKDDSLTPHSMQLDFLFVHHATTPATDGGGPHGRCRLKAVATEATRPRSFFVKGSPLSDHYGLTTTFTVDVEDA